MSSEYQPRYKWRETWPGENHQDFAAFDGELQFGRISLDMVTKRKGQWRWSMAHIAWQREKILPHNGWAPTAREASRLVEELYHRLCEMHGR